MHRVIFLWVAWCVTHSLLVTTGVRQWFERRGGVWLALYRLGYVCFSLCSLLVLLWYTATLPQQAIDLPIWLWTVRGLLFLYALVMFIGGSRIYDFQTFVGLRQWRDYRAGRTSNLSGFTKSGILRYIRHPWYSGGIALLWALPHLTDVTLVTRSILTVYLIVGTLLEERKLRQNYGESYKAYCRETPMLIPWKFGR